MSGTGRTYSTTFVDWLIANHLQNKNIDPKYGYNYAPISKPNSTTHYTTTATGGGNIKKIAAEYITFASGTPFKITFLGHSSIDIKAIKIGPSGSVIEPVTLGAEYNVPDFGTTYTEVTFVVYRDSEFDTNTSEDVPTRPYSYVAIGSGGGGSQTVELAYEDGEPEGLLEFATGDSSAVFFTGISGGKLESIKIAFRRTGTIQMDISELGSQTFLRGTNLYGPVQINSPSETASVPYPVPYDNWVTVDLSSEDIDATNDFVVSFLIGSDPLAPGIMISSEPDDGIRNSRTYYKSDNQWYSISDGGNPGNIFKYLIRAYVSVGGGTVAIDQTGIVTIPSEFSLEQNYPNPFNPSTTFRFSTPEDGLVKFTVHDLLGRVVYSESRDMFAGNYSFTWEGKNQLDQQVVSGVYFLRMEAEGFTQTRKMLMMK